MLKLKNTVTHWAMLGALLLSACGETQVEKTTVDVLIVGGEVYDGTGNASVKADIAILGDQIVYFGTDGSSQYVADKVVDASGLVVAPGFIDPHTHSLADLLSDTKNSNANYLTQGVTTVMNGNDGRGLPRISSTIENLSENGIGTNTALFVGHGAVRTSVLGMANRAPSPEELAEMNGLVEQAMQQGAFGLSGGLYYSPGSFSETDEVISLSKTAAKYGGIYESHIRDESSYNIGLVASIQEVIDIGQAAKLPVHVSHIKALGVDVWGKSEEVIALINEARASGLKVTADQYPWLASGTGVKNALMPRHALAGGDEALAARLRDPMIKAELLPEIADNLRRRGGASSLLLTQSDANIQVGRTLEEEAEARGKSAIETAIEIVLEGDSKVASFNMHEDDLIAFMQQPWVMSSSDGSSGHPRKYASYPEKYKEYVKKRQVLTVAEYIHKNTHMVAETFNVCGRGVIKENTYADIVIFDAERFGPKADYLNPEELSEGVVHVFVNGAQAIADGSLTGGLYGQPLKPGDMDQLCRDKQ